jgi:hypothetical protein
MNEQHSARPTDEHLIAMARAAAVDLRRTARPTAADAVVALANEAERLRSGFDALLDLAKQYASECSECEGAGLTGSYQDNVPGDITKGVHEVEIDCPDCRDIRDVIAKAEGRS